MKKILVITVLSLLLTGMAVPEQNLRTLGDGTEIAKEIYNIHIMDLKLQKTSKLMVSAAPSIHWSEDGDYLLVEEQATNDKHSIIWTNLHLFSKKSFKELILPAAARDKAFPFTYASFSGNDRLLIQKYSQSSQKYLLYNIKTGKINYISEEKHDLLYGSSSENSDDAVSHKAIYMTSREAILPINFERGAYSYDKRKFLYSTPEKEVYLYDTNNHTKTFLFKGLFNPFNIEWSQDEKTILYYLPKKASVETFSTSRNYVPGADFYSYVYDLENHRSIQFAPAYTHSKISPDGRYVVFMPVPYYFGMLYK